MSELTGLGPEMLAEILAEMPEATRTVTYRQGSTDIGGVTAIPSKLKFGEADGESVKVTDSVWLIFSHQVPSIEPNADDWLIHGANEHFVLRSSGDPAGITWRLITRG